MAYINLNGRLIEISQEQYDLYTKGLGLDPLGRDTVATQPNNPAAGGTQTISNTVTSTIINPNTTNNTPGQTLTTTDIQAAVKQSIAQDTTTNIDLQALVREAAIKDSPTPVSDTSNINLQALVKNSIDTTTGPVENSSAVRLNNADVPVFRQDQVNTVLEVRPDPVSNPPDPQVVTPTTPPISASELNRIAEAQGVDVGGPIDTVSEAQLYRGESSFTPEQLDAIATAQGVDAGNTATAPGTITEASLYQGQNSLTPEQLDAIARSNGVDAGDVPVGDVTEQQLYQAENSADPVAAGANNARQQQTRSDQRRTLNNGDWRLRLSLADSATYLYKDPGINSTGILYPLQVTNGVIFPYTPSINTSYVAGYSPYDLTHSNFRGYFYQNSYINDINVTATFTAQDTSEANYLLAVIHFFRSVTKMFYGQDAERGSPPPVTYLTGFGEFQFQRHPVLVKSFNYALPADVDYIRCRSPNQVGLNLSSRRDKSEGVATNAIFGQANRLAAALLPKGGVTTPPAPPNLGLNNPTYVPTKIDIQLVLLPIQSRQQVSKQFSVKNFANGNLLKGGFW
jgi:hypothetical protein